MFNLLKVERLTCSAPKRSLPGVAIEVESSTLLRCKLMARRHQCCRSNGKSRKKGVTEQLKYSEAEECVTLEHTRRCSALRRLARDATHKTERAHSRPASIWRTGFAVASSKVDSRIRRMAVVAFTIAVCAACRRF